MDQTIGIGYQVDGVNRVVEENNKVIASFDRVVTKLVGVGSSISGALNPVMQFANGLTAVANASVAIKGLGVQGAKLGDFFKGSGSIGAAARSAELFNKAITETPAKASAATNALNQLTSAVTAYNTAMGTAKTSQINPMKVDRSGNVIPFQQQKGGGGGGGRGGKQAPDDTGSIFYDTIIGKAPWFMLRYRLYSELLSGLNYSLVDIGLGRSRQKLAASLGELSPLGFDQNLKKDTEFAGKLFSQKFWTVSAESYAAAMTQTASAFDVQTVGFANLQKMNEASLKVSMISKMSVEKTAELMTKTMLGFMNQLPSEVSSQLQKGLKADVKGYGNVDLGGLAQGMAAQIGKTIAVSSIWGPGVQSSFRYLLPSVLQRGWSLPSALALVGATADVGFQPGQGGRGQKDLFEGEGNPMAKMIMQSFGLMRDTKNPNLTGEQRKANKFHNEQWETAIKSKLVNKMMSNEEDAPRFLEWIGAISKDLEAQGFDIVKNFGVSKQWTALFRSVTTGAFRRRLEEVQSKIANSTDAALTKVVEETLLDAGTAYEKVAGSFQNLSTSLADWPGAHKIAGAISRPLSFLTIMIEAQKAILRNPAEWDGEKIWKWSLEYQDQFSEQFGSEGAKMIRDKMYSALRTGKEAPIIDSFIEGLLLNPTSPVGKAAKSIWDFLKPGKTAEEDLKDFVDLAKSINSYILPWNWGESTENATVFPRKISGTDLPSMWDAASDFVGSVANSVNDFGNIINDGISWVASKLWGYFNNAVSAIEGYIGKIAPYIPSFLKSSPAPSGEPLDGLVSPHQRFEMYAPPQLQSGGEPPQIHLLSQIDNKLHLDSRVLAQVVGEIVQRNRDTHYHGYGGAPLGYAI